MRPSARGCGLSWSTAGRWNAIVRARHGVAVGAHPESSRRAQPQPFVIGSATELFEPLPKLGAFGLLAVCDDLFGCPAGGFSGGLFCRCPYQAQFGRC